MPARDTQIIWVHYSLAACATAGQLQVTRVAASMLFAKL